MLSQYIVVKNVEVNLNIPQCVLSRPIQDQIVPLIYQQSNLDMYTGNKQVCTTHVIHLAYNILLKLCYGSSLVTPLVLVSNQIYPEKSCFTHWYITMCQSTLDEVLTVFLFAPLAASLYWCGVAVLRVWAGGK